MQMRWTADGNRLSVHGGRNQSAMSASGKQSDKVDLSVYFKPEE